MLIDKIASEERGITSAKWLNSKHTYSFGNYYNLSRLNFGTLRVFNEDIIQPSRGFELHPHENMEIVTIVLQGQLEHTDSKGNTGFLKAGDVQRMTAGTGIEHSEKNASKEEPLHLLQVWIYPNERNLSPSYEQRNFPLDGFHNAFKQIVSSRPSASALTIHQDVTFYLGHFDTGQTLFHVPRNKKHGEYVFVIEGALNLAEGIVLHHGDSAQVTKIDSLEIQTLLPTKILIIEVNTNTL